jgi:hypothetical protein
MGFLAGQADRLLRTTATTSPAYATIPTDPGRAALRSGAAAPPGMQSCQRFPRQHHTGRDCLAWPGGAGKVRGDRRKALGASTCPRPAAAGWARGFTAHPRPAAILEPPAWSLLDREAGWRRCERRLHRTVRRAQPGTLHAEDDLPAVGLPGASGQAGTLPPVGRRAGDPVGPTEPAGEVALVGEPGREGDLGDRRPRRQPPPGLSQPELAQVGAGRNTVPVPELAPGRRTTRPSAPPKEDSTRRRTIALLITRPLTCGTDFWHSTGIQAAHTCPSSIIRRHRSGSRVGCTQRWSRPGRSATLSRTASGSASAPDRGRSPLPLRTSTVAARPPGRRRCRRLGRRPRPARSMPRRRAPPAGR